LVVGGVVGVFGGRLDVAWFAVDLDGDVHVADGEDISRSEVGLIDALVVLEGAVGGSEVSDACGRRRGGGCGWTLVRCVRRCRFRV